MRSAAQPSIVARVQNPDLLDQVDYRLAETPAEKEEIYNLRYRAYLREGAIRPSAEQRVADQFEDAPNAWTFGVYFHGELYSSIRVSVLTSEWRLSPSVELFGDVLHPQLDKGMIFIDSTRFVADPEKAQEFSGTSLCDGPAGFDGRRLFQRGLRARDRSSRASGVLSQSVPAGDLVRAAIVPGSRKAGRIDGRASADRPRKGAGPLPVPAFERVRTADVVPAARRAPFIFARADDDPVRPRLDRSAAVLRNQPGVPRGTHQLSLI